MSLKLSLFNFLKRTIKSSVSLFGEQNKNLALSKLTEDLAPIYETDTQYGKIFFYCIGELALYRAETLLTKEPETINWIDSFKENDILFDIGANIGCYSLYAAKKNVSVIAFEPAAVNYFLLQKNIEINNLDSKIQAFCIAFNDKSQTGFLHMPSTQMGGAINLFGKDTENFSYMGESWNVKFRQGMISFSVDEFLQFYHLTPPNHIKIDVDGIEDKIIRGAKTTLSSQKVKSMLVELDINSPHYNGIIREIQELGFILETKKHAAIFDTGQYSTIFNHIFIRANLN